MYRFLVGLGAAYLFLSAPILAYVRTQEKSIWTSPIRKCWTYGSNELLSLKGASDNELTIVIPSSKTVVSAIDSQTGQTLWKKDLKKTLNSDLSIDSSTLYFSTTSGFDGREKKSGQFQTDVYSVDVDSGINNWSLRLTNDDNGSNTYLISGQPNLLVANANGKVFSVSKLDGTVQWNADLGTSLSAPPVVFQDMVLFATANRTIVTLSKTNGDILNQIPTRILPSAMQIVNNSIYVGGQLGSVSALRLPDGGMKWRVRSGGKISGMLLLDSNILATSNDNYAYLLRSKNGKKLWKRKLSGRILGTAIVGKKIGVFLSTGSNEAILLDLNTGKIINRISSESTEYFIGAPITVGDRVILPTNNGLEAYSPKCKNSADLGSNLSQKIKTKNRKNQERSPNR